MNFIDRLENRIALVGSAQVDGCNWIESFIGPFHRDELIDFLFNRGYGFEIIELAIESMIKNGYLQSQPLDNLIYS